MALVNPAFAVPGTAVVDIYAEDLFHTKRYLVHFVLATGIGENSQPLVQLYPNPVSETLNISGLKDASIKLFSVNGKEMMSLERFSGNTIDVSKLPAGVYIMNVTTVEGLQVRKKIIVY